MRLWVTGLGTVKVHLGSVRDVPTIKRPIIPNSPAVVRPQSPIVETPRQDFSEQDILSDLSERIIRSGYRGVPKKSSSISSNISSGFISRTGGQDLQSVIRRPEKSNSRVGSSVRCAGFVDSRFRSRDEKSLATRETTKIDDVSRALQST